MLDIDSARRAAEALWKEVESQVGAIETEEDARFRLIDRMLVDVLGWDRADFKMEPHSDSGYADYLLHISSERALVVEAKRVGKVLVDTLSEDMRGYDVNGPALKSAAEGVAQAARYCFDHGVNIAAVTTGLVWIVFQPFPGNGASYKDGRAIVFPNFKAILTNFAVFFDLVSKAGVAKKTYKLQLAKAGGLTVQEFDPLISVNVGSERRMLPKSAMALDLDPVFREFFGQISGDNDPALLVECFVETRESALADASLEKIVRDISANIEALGTAKADQLDVVHSNQRVAISHAGRMHFEMATTDPIYLMEMALATPLRAAAVVDQLRSILKNWNDDSAGELIGRFFRYCVDEDAVFSRIPSDALYNGQRQFREEFAKRWAIGGGDTPTLFSGRTIAPAEPSLQAGLSHVAATVIWFDAAKGYGFVDCGLKGDAIIGRKTLEAAQIMNVSPGDRLVCDVAPGTAGKYQVIQAHSLERGAQKPSEQEYVEGEVVFFNEHKKFAFAEVPTLSDAVYIPIRVMLDAGVDRLYAGMKVEMVIEPGRFGRSTCVILNIPDEVATA